MIDAHFAPVTLWPPLHMEFDGAVSIVALSQVGLRTLRTAAEMEWLGRNMGWDGAVVEEKGLEAAEDGGQAAMGGGNEGWFQGGA